VNASKAPAARLYVADTGSTVNASKAPAARTAYARCAPRHSLRSSSLAALLVTRCARSCGAYVAYAVLAAAPLNPTPHSTAPHTSPASRLTTRGFAARVRRVPRARCSRPYQGARRRTPVFDL